MHSEIRQVIVHSHLFAGLRPDLIDEIASSATHKTIAAGEILFQKGDPANALWGVLSGCIAIEVGTDDGKEMVLGETQLGIFLIHNGGYWPTPDLYVAKTHN